VAGVDNETLTNIRGLSSANAWASRRRPIVLVVRERYGLQKTLDNPLNVGLRRAGRTRRVATCLFCALPFDRPSCRSYRSEIGPSAPKLLPPISQPLPCGTVLSRVLSKSRSARLVVLLLAAATILLFLLLDRLTNGLPPQTRTNGGVALLVKQSSPSAGDSVNLMVTGSAKDGGRLLQVDVVVCGPQPDWRGELYITGTATLSGPTLLGFPDSRGNPTHPPASFRRASGPLSLAGSELGLIQNAQIYDVAMSNVFLCSPGVVGGEAWSLTGLTASPMVHSDNVLFLRGARRFISLPATGLLPHATSLVSGVFVVPGLSGQWSLPIPATYSSTIEQAPTSLVEFAEPNDPTLVSGLRWTSHTPEPVEAQVVYPATEDHLRTLLTGATVLLALGGSLLAEAGWQAISRRGEADPTPAPTPIPAPTPMTTPTPRPDSAVSSSLALLLAIAIGWFLGRKSRK
jgi:hypothetical protein